MRIVMVSIPTLHFFRWADQLKNSGHEVFWFDISGMSDYVEKLNWLEQKINWKLKHQYPGRVFIKKTYPKLYNFIQSYNENKTETIFEEYLKDIKPDLVHSFALYVSCTPIYEVMKKYENIKWVYSSWGSDLFYFQNNKAYLDDIQRILPRINYLFTDCERDYHLAKKHGFKGEFLGVFPGGGGFDVEYIHQYNQPTKNRKIILIKGFQGRSGRAITVLQALGKLKKTLRDYEIIVFGAGAEVVSYYNKGELKSWKNIKILGRINHEDVLQFMGNALIYVGNSNSDGMPNTLLEAVIAGAFPIQSNPGGATAEIVEHGVNGFLIEDYNDCAEIESLIVKAVNNMKLIQSAHIYNQTKIKPNLSRKSISKEVIKKYNSIIN
ncbi:glycosyltransferase family 4 protein [Flaviramulus sp. BrNp1-15]|uniref:glycosyltransferase family 4 protein n=1 Tax=Flaviramulus sp. BrNp1-15 TaxID=2916754 RepID=UPI001EE956BB|nr:glycosyltransferase family 4 protein [Flaviramulus sp. BrNp1-15]ULC60574.1 glycosyltransferase family 4 protein [Flaviramulus sp. BrNp1-15]